MKVASENGNVDASSVSCFLSIMQKLYEETHTAEEVYTLKQKAFGINSL